MCGPGADPRGEEAVRRADEGPLEGEDADADAPPDEEQHGDDELDGDGAEAPGGGEHLGAELRLLRLQHEEDGGSDERDDRGGQAVGGDAAWEGAHGDQLDHAAEEQQDERVHHRWRRARGLGADVGGDCLFNVACRTRSLQPNLKFATHASMHALLAFMSE